MPEHPLQTYKPDWPEARQRLCDWWAGKPTDRAVAVIHAPRRGAERRPVRTDVPDKYIEPEVVFHNVDAQLANTFYGGEAVPMHWVYIGPAPMGGFMGCELHFEEATVWQSPLYESWDVLEEIRFDRRNKWYRLLCELTRMSVERARGRYLVSGQGFGCISDCVAAMWGSEETLMAMAERPETVRAIIDRLTGITIEMFDEVHGIVEGRQDGYFDWIRLWAPGSIWTMQSDLCCMISPAMFERFVYEELRREAEHADYSFYHLDGPDAVKHLDALLSIEALDGIQWVPGAGASNDPMDWIDLFRRIEQAGRKIQIACPPERVEPLLERVSPQSVCLNIGCRSQDAAEDVLRRLDRIGT